MLKGMGHMHATSTCVIHPPVERLDLAHVGGMDDFRERQPWAWDLWALSFQRADGSAAAWTRVGGLGLLGSWGAS